MSLQKEQTSSQGRRPQEKQKLTGKKDLVISSGYFMATEILFTDHTLKILNCNREGCCDTLSLENKTKNSIYVRSFFFPKWNFYFISKNIPLLIDPEIYKLIKVLSLELNRRFFFSQSYFACRSISKAVLFISGRNQGVWISKCFELCQELV